MRIELAKLSPGVNRFEGALAAVALGLDDEEGIMSVGDAVYRLNVQCTSRTLVVQGSVGASMDLACARCGKIFSTWIGDSGFLRDYAVIEQTEAVEVTVDLREAVLLHLPAVAWCRPDCRGVCARCGCDLNEEACECGAPPSDDRWGILNEMGLM